MDGTARLPPGGGRSAPALDVSDVRIQGDTASARVTRPGVDATIHLRREAGVWKVCEPADGELSATASRQP
ncbi:hypothetical protein ABT247_22590 [Kitasatospora sp. NPDC001539]|uniref:hypothetical protein n=1 Tax=Kitasatospora sp. NPDC001539 TaxID=3154384 RepID=UPI00332B7813